MSINPKAAFAEGTSVVPALISVRGSEARRKMEALNDDIEREALLDGITTNLDMKVSGWLDFYEAMRLVEENEAYWKTKGFDTFSGYLSATVGTSFDEWRDLEAIYNYAKAACPSLFNIDDARVASLTKRIHEIPPLGAHGEGHKKEGLKSQLAAGKQTGQHSAERVVAQLKRDGRDDIIAKAMTELEEGVIGNFVRKDKNDNLFWSVATFQRAAGIETREQQKARLSANKPAPAKRVETLLKKATGDDQAAIIDVLKSYPWIVKGVSS